MSNSWNPNVRVVRPNGEPVRRAATPIGPPPDSPQWASLTALAVLLKNPERALLPIIVEMFGQRGSPFQMDVLQVARNLMEEVIGPLKSGTESAPMIVDRYSFAWRLLRQADIAIRRLKKADLPQRGSLDSAAAIFGSLLSVAPNEPLVVAISDVLRLGPEAQDLPQYCLIRKATKRSDLPPPFAYAVDKENREALATVAWWSIRSRKEEYVEVGRDEVRIKFAFLVEETLAELRQWYGPGIDSSSWIPGVVEDEINRWMAYSGLQAGLDRPTRDDIAKDLAKAFLKHNELTTKLRMLEAPSRALDDRTAALEVQLRQYADENRALEQTVQQLKTTVRPELDVVERGNVEIRDFFRTLDSKYSFDALEAIQLGEESPLTLRSFVMHLFYCARKQGLTQYPNQDSFDLSYGESGLYECEGFDVPPDGVVAVRVTRRGWALKTGSHLLPVRRARVSPGDKERS